jgi:hypothetical protein
VTVILLGDLVEDLAVTTGLGCAWHARKVDDDQDEPAAHGTALIAGRGTDPIPLRESRALLDQE